MYKKSLKKGFMQAPASPQKLCNENERNKNDGLTLSLDHFSYQNYHNEAHSNSLSVLKSNQQSTKLPMILHFKLPFDLAINRRPFRFKKIGLYFQSWR